MISRVLKLGKIRCKILLEYRTKPLPDQTLLNVVRIYCQNIFSPIAGWQLLPLFRVQPRRQKIDRLHWWVFLAPGPAPPAHTLHQVQGQGRRSPVRPLITRPHFHWVQDRSTSQISFQEVHKNPVSIELLKNKEAARSFWNVLICPSSIVVLRTQKTYWK